MELSISTPVTISAIPGIPEIDSGDDLAQIILASLDRAQMNLEEGDILIVAQKVVSKAEGRLVSLDTVTPSQEALTLAQQVNKDPRKIEVILRESSRVVRAVKRADDQEGIVITEHNLGFVCANSAVDESNCAQQDTLILLPVDPDLSARKLRDSLSAAFGVRVGVVITDTFGRPWRMGLVNVAIGLAGVPAKVDLIGEKDAFGRELLVTSPALADELAAASGLLMTKDGMKPAILFKGVDWVEQQSSARELVRPANEDLFR
jgi:coenzyme F420-0:L-glutamate ligase/coenzyme F420-1:gamma-L-glutamate ligase